MCRLMDYIENPVCSNMKEGGVVFSFGFFTTFILSKPKGSLMHLELSPVEDSCGSSCETAQPTQNNRCHSPTSYTVLLLPFPCQTVCLFQLTVCRIPKEFRTLFWSSWPKWEIVISENHRRDEVGRNLWRSPCSTPAKEGTLMQGAQDIRWLLKTSRES